MTHYDNVVAYVTSLGHLQGDVMIVRQPVGDLGEIMLKYQHGRHVFLDVVVGRFESRLRIDQGIGATWKDGRAYLLDRTAQEEQSFGSPDSELEGLMDDLLPAVIPAMNDWMGPLQQAYGHLMAYVRDSERQSPD